MSTTATTLNNPPVMETNGHSSQHASVNPTPSSDSRYDNPITAAQQKGLPIIDISSFLDPVSSESARQTTAQALNAACTNYGFFYLTGHGIPISTLDNVVSLARQFFARPLMEKNKIKRFDAGGPEAGDGARGYQGLGENVTGGLQDMQEAVDWYAEWPETKREVGDGGPGTVKTLQGRNLWPEEPKELRSVYEGYVEAVKGVGRAVVKAMAVALELGPPSENSGGDEEDEEVFVRNCQDSFWVMRMIGYPPLPSSFKASSSSSTATPTNSTTNNTSASQPRSTETEEKLSQFSCGAHTDYGCVTLLLSDSTPHALQVQLRDGSWLYADPLPGAFVVNIGDMIERWTNGLWKSTMHRVIHRGSSYRVSVPFFFEPGFDSVVRPLRKCVVKSGGGEVGEREGKGRGEYGTYGEHLLTKVFSNFYFSKRTDW